MSRNSFAPYIWRLIYLSHLGHAMLTWPNRSIRGGRYSLGKLCGYFFSVSPPSSSHDGKSSMFIHEMSWEYLLWRVPSMNHNSLLKEEEKERGERASERGDGQICLLWSLLSRMNHAQRWNVTAKQKVPTTPRETEKEREGRTERPDEISSIRPFWLVFL